MKTLFLASLLALAACASSPYGQPYSIIQVEVVRSADYHVIPVIINRVDGETQIYRRYAIVGPGTHQVTVDVPPRKGFHLATQVTFPLETGACTRYTLSARLDTPVTQQWTPVVRSVEPIGECESKFHVASTAR